MSVARRPAIAVALIMALMSAPAFGAAPPPSRYLVCIDPGHGGSDPGAVANGVREKDVNLDIAMRAGRMIRAKGFGVVMTRESDVYLSLQDRCTIANRAGATIFVSVHNNAFTSTSRGTETYCYYSSGEGRRLATLIHKEVVRRIKRPNRGVKEAGFYVLKNTDMTAALLEGAFLTNPEEAGMLADPGFRQKIAEGIAEGVGGYLVDPGRFEEYIIMMNPDPDRAAQVKLTFMRADGTRQRMRREVAPMSRMTLRLDDFVFNTDVSTLVESENGVPVVAERSMYFDFEKGRGGSDTQGAFKPAKTWYLAEGSTDWGFSTFILLQNPGSSESRVTVDFLRSDGVRPRVKFKLPAHSRYTLDASGVPGLEKADFSTIVTSSRPVVVERSMYFDHWGKPGGHSSCGTKKPRTRWYLAEGYTGGGFDTYVLITNPNAQEARATVRCMLPGGKEVRRERRLPPYSRRTVHLDEIPGLSDTDVSTRVDATLPVVVERSMYFDYMGIREGSNSPASPEPANRWYLAEGHTGGGFDTHILLFNPGASSSDVRLDFLLNDGSRRKIGVVLKGRSRCSVKVNSVAGMQNAGFSTVITSGQPIVVERSVYFKSASRAGGHSAMGVRTPSPTWYFAEGCTR